MMRATRSVEPPSGKPSAPAAWGSSARSRAPRRPEARRQPQRDAEIRGGGASLPAPPTGGGGPTRGGGPPPGSGPPSFLRPGNGARSYFRGAGETSQPPAGGD